MGADCDVTEAGVPGTGMSLTKQARERGSGEAFDFQ
jgi:hypothetical protein